MSLSKTDSMLERSLKQSVSRSATAKKENMLLGGILSLMCIGIMLSLGVTLCVLVIGHGKALEQLNDHIDDMGEVGEILKQWSRRPFVDIISVLSEDGCPSSHPELVVFDVWPGTMPLCICGPDFSSTYWTLGEKCRNKYVKNSEGTQL